MKIKLLIAIIFCSFLLSGCGRKEYFCQNDTWISLLRVNYFEADTKLGFWDNGRGTFFIYQKEDCEEIK